MVKASSVKYVEHHLEHHSTLIMDHFQRTSNIERLYGFEICIISNIYRSKELVKTVQRINPFKKV